MDDAPTFKTYDYATFIGELQQFAAETEGLAKSDVTEGHLDFKSWRLRLNTAIDQIEELGYPDVRCGVGSRNFATAYGTPRDNRSVFVHDLMLTKQELDLIVEGYKNYGPPRRKGDKPPEQSVEQQHVPAAPPILPVPQTLTLRWLFDHAPASWWAWSIGALLVIGGGGITVGKYLDSVDKALHTPSAGTSLPPAKSASR